MPRSVSSKNGEEISCTTMPMVSERPFLSPCAIWFGAKLTFSMAASTASRLSSETLAVPLRMRETVLGETPARRATSINVDGPEEGEVSGNVQSLTKYYEILFSEDYHI